jgi:hypothetical protein
MSPKAAGTPIYLYSGGREETHRVHGRSGWFIVYRLVVVFSLRQPYAPPSRALRRFGT